MVDRRFLNANITILGVVKEPPSGTTYAAGDQYIVAAEPTGAFAGHVNEIARYDGKKWIFYPPRVGYLELINIATGEFLKFDGYSWVVVLKNDNDVYFKFVADIVDEFVESNSEPTVTTKGNTYIVSNSHYKKICGTYETTELDTNLNVLIAGKTPKSYNYVNNNYVKDNEWVFDDRAIYISKLTGEAYYYHNNKLIKIGGSEDKAELIKVRDVVNAVSDNSSAPEAATGHKGYRYAYINHIIETLDNAATNTREIITLIENEYVFALSNSHLYQLNGDTLRDVGTLPDNAVIISEETGKHYGKVNGVWTKLEKEHVFTPILKTEFVTLTAENITNKSFNLSEEVANGYQETVVCFISGVAHAAGVAFAATANSNVIRWTSPSYTFYKDGLMAGDLVIIQYVAAE